MARVSVLNPRILTQSRIEYLRQKVAFNHQAKHTSIILHKMSSAKVISTVNTTQPHKIMTTITPFKRNRVSQVSKFVVFTAAAYGILSLLFDGSTIRSDKLFVSSLSMRASPSSRSKSIATSTALFASANDKSNDEGVVPTRRNVLGATTASALGFAAGTMAPWFSVAAQAAEAKGPIAIVGASGRTGSLCVNACIRRGIPVKALTRTGEWTSPPTPEGAVTTFAGDASNLLSVAQCDVTSNDLQALTKTLEGCSAVIYAASASKKGGTAIEVDNRGVCKVAEAALAAKVSRYIVISSTSTTRPKSLGYIFTNLGVGGNIMGEKRNGEVGTMAAYQNQSPLSYTIVRPGGLEEPKRNKVLGPSALEISQGDVFAGIISRADVAEVCVELAASEASNVKNTSVELYYSESVIEVEGKFKSLLAAAKEEGSPENKQLRLHGSTYEALFEGIRPGVDFAE